MCAPHFKRSKLDTSKFGVRRSLLTDKLPTEKMGDLMVCISISLIGLG